jgi:hypothetical protein
VPLSSSQKSEELSQHLYSFRISDRAQIERTLKSPNGNNAAFMAVTDYVKRWENSDWLEAYSIERIGKWFGRHANSILIEKLETWAIEQDTAARLALLEGLKKGRSVRLNS